MRRPTGISRIDSYVALIVFSAALGLLATSVIRAPYPGTWAIAVFALIAFLLEGSATKLRLGDAVGSLAFILHLSSFVLFGPFWAGLITGISTLAGQLVNGNPTNRVLFNTGQQVLSVVVAGSLFLSLGGANPPTIIVPGLELSFEGAIRELLPFFAGAFAYFVLNSAMVSTALAISTGRTFAAVWATNTLWVLGYDIAASSFSLFVCWLYLYFDNQRG